MRFYINFLNPFGKQEAKIWLFNIYIYKDKEDNYKSVTIDLLNFTFKFYWYKS